MNIDTWQDAQVLVTGARGFVAGHLCRHLLQAGAVVHGISRDPNALDGSGVRGWRADLTQIAEVRHIIATTAPRVVFHLAGHVTGSQQLAEVIPAFETNLTSTVNLLTATADRPHCRVVLAGSMQEPDWQAGGAIPSSPYAASKWAAAGYARMFHALYQAPVIIARMMLVYGPGQWQRWKLLPSVIESLLQGTAPRLTSGTREVDWVYVDDIARGLMTLASSPNVEGRTIDLGSGRLVSIRRVVEEIRDIIGSDVMPLFGAIPDRPFEFPCAARVAETRRLTGWEATTPLRAGLAQMVDWHRHVAAAETPV